MGAALLLRIDIYIYTYAYVLYTASIYINVHSFLERTSRTEVKASCLQVPVIQSPRSRVGSGGLRASTRPQTQGAARVGGVPRGRGGGASLQAQLRHLEGPRSTLDARARPAPPPPCSQRGSHGLGRGPRGAPLHSMSGPPVLPAHVARRACTAGQAPRGSGTGGLETHTHTHAGTTHIQRRLSVRPSGPGLRPWASRPQWSTACHRRLGELGSALTLVGTRPAGRRPFTSEGPRCREGLEGAGRGQTQSRPPRSWSWGCPGRPVSTAQRAPTGPGTRRWT